MRICCIIQARSGSTRLPNKVLMKISGKEMLIHIIERVLNSKKIGRVIVATTTNKEDDKIEKLVLNYNNRKVAVFRGSEDDVLDRYYQAAKKSGAGIIVRVTGDCPLIDWEIIDLCVSEFLKGNLDYVSNVIEKRTFPRGLDAEVFSFKVLEFMWKNCPKKREREHVTAYIRENPSKFKIKSVENNTDLSSLRWTVDEKDDLALVKKIYGRLYDLKSQFKMQDVLDLLSKMPELSKINEEVEQKKNVRTEAN